MQVLWVIKKEKEGSRKKERKNRIGEGERKEREESFLGVITQPVRK